MFSMLHYRCRLYFLLFWQECGCNHQHCWCLGMSVSVFM